MWNLKIENVGTADGEKQMSNSVEKPRKVDCALTGNLKYRVQENVAELCYPIEYYRPQTTTKSDYRFEFHDLFCKYCNPNWVCRNFFVETEKFFGPVPLIISTNSVQKSFQQSFFFENYHFSVNRKQVKWRNLKKRLNQLESMGDFDLLGEIFSVRKLNCLV